MKTWIYHLENPLGILNHQTSPRYAVMDTGKDKKVYPWIWKLKPSRKIKSSPTQHKRWSKWMLGHFIIIFNQIWYKHYKLIDNSHFKILIIFICRDFVWALNTDGFRLFSGDETGQIIVHDFLHVDAQNAALQDAQTPALKMENVKDQASS